MGSNFEIEKIWKNQWKGQGVWGLKKGYATM